MSNDGHSTLNVENSQSSIVMVLLVRLLKVGAFISACLNCQDQHENQVSFFIQRDGDGARWAQAVGAVPPLSEQFNVQH